MRAMSWHQVAVHVVVQGQEVEIESMHTHGDVIRMDAEVALVLVDKLSSWLSLPEASSYLDSHLNVACKIHQHLATLPSSPPDTSCPVPSTLRTAPAAQHGGEPSPAPPASIPPADQARGCRPRGQATSFGHKAKQDASAFGDAALLSCSEAHGAGLARTHAASRFVANQDATTQGLPLPFPPPVVPWHSRLSCDSATIHPFFFNFSNLYSGVSKQTARHTVKYI